MMPSGRDRRPLASPMPTQIALPAPKWKESAARVAIGLRLRKTVEVPKFRQGRRRRRQAGMRIAIADAFLVLVDERPHLRGKAHEKKDQCPLIVTRALIGFVRSALVVGKIQWLSSVRVTSAAGQITRAVPRIVDAAR
jgi:hypothetical protein